MKRSPTQIAAWSMVVLFVYVQLSWWFMLAADIDAGRSASDLREKSWWLFALPLMFLFAARVALHVIWIYTRKRN